MDIMLFLFSLIVSICLLVTAAASIAFLIFMVMLVQEFFSKSKIKSLVMSDFVTPQNRLAV